MELIDNLVKELGVSSEQAEGGAGLLLKLAKEKLGSEDFSQVSKLIPDIEHLIGKAPATAAAASEGGSQGGSLLGAIESVAKSVGLGDLAEKLEGLAGVSGGFSKLNLDTDMIMKFVSQILSYLKAHGGETIEAIMKNVLK